MTWIAPRPRWIGCTRKWSCRGVGWSCGTPTPGVRRPMCTRPMRRVVVRVEVAGMKETDLAVSLTDRVLVITGVRQDPSPKVAYHQMEIRYGEFRTEVFLALGRRARAHRGHLFRRFSAGDACPRCRARKVHVVQVTNRTERRLR